MPRQEYQSELGIAELTRTNERLRDKVKELTEDRARLANHLAETLLCNQTERQARRAALNLMEDAVNARAAEQRQNAERRRVEQELRDADQRKDQFLATLAHELRNPLAPIRNCVQILRKTHADTTTAEQVYEMLERQVNHMVRLVDDLMEVSRITRGQIELQKERFELSTMLQSAIEISLPLIESAHHELSLVMPTEPVFLFADRVRLAQVFANLLNNAAKYTPEGGNISLTAEVQNDWVAVTVRDNGMGIPADILPRIFELFIQGDRRHARFPGGLGIGLTLVRQLVELHGGSVAAKSEGAGQGSAFLVSLPVASDQAGECSDFSVDENSSIPSLRILVVDDNQDAAESLATLLRSLGCDVSTAHDGPTALQLFDACKPSIILLDIGMPHMDGNEVARRIRRDSAGQNVVLIALTGWGQAEDRRRSTEAGFNYHLVKPVKLRELQKILNSLDSRAPGMVDT